MSEVVLNGEDKWNGWIQRKNLADLGSYAGYETKPWKNEKYKRRNKEMKIRVEDMIDQEKMKKEEMRKDWEEIKIKSRRNSKAKDRREGQEYM